MLDSGAFSAYKLGKPVNLEAYCDYIDANRDWISHYIALDYIGEYRADTRTPEANAAKGYEYFLYMRKRGLDPIPVFHAGENIEWLYRMLDAGCKYIGISGTSIDDKDTTNFWYSQIFSHLVNKEGLPIVKTHSFGEGRPWALDRYPWKSADCSSWTFGGQRLARPLLTNGNRVSIRTDWEGNRATPEISFLEGEDLVEWHAFLRELGIDPALFDNKINRKANNVQYTLRGYMSYAYYMKLQNGVRAKQPINYKSRGFFVPSPKDAPSVSVDPFNFHLVISNPTTYPVIAKCGYTNVLASYFYLHPMWKDFVYDPQGTCERAVGLNWNTYWKILEEHVKL